MKKATVHIFFLLMAFSLLTKAQTAFYSSQLLDEKNESLPVNTLYKDSQGYLWIGAKGGLYQFNGKSFRNHLPDSLKIRLTITAIMEDEKKRLWFGCSNGYIAYLENGKIVTYTPEEGLPKKSITDILFDGNNRLWFSTANEGVYFENKNKLYNFNTEDGLTDNFVYALSLDINETILAGTDRGISLLTTTEGKKKSTSFSSMNGLPDNIVRAICPGKQPGTFWIGMEDKGICLFDARQRKILPYYIIPAWRFGPVNDIVFIDNSLWIATEDSGLVHVSLDKETLLYEHQFLPVFPKMSALVKDDEGQLWFSQPGKITRTSVLQLRFLRQLGKESFKAIHALYTSNDKSTWISQGKNLQQLQYNGSGWIIKNSYTFPGVKLQDITALYEDIHGMLWIGTIGAGIIRLNPVDKRWNLIKGNPVLEKGHILSINGRGPEVWISGLNGLSNYHVDSLDDTNKPLAFTNYNKQSGIGSDYVYQVFIDHQNRVWFATDGAGVACKVGNKITSYKNKNGLTSDVIYGITEDRDGILWLNTLDKGIVRFDGNNFIPSYQLPNNAGSTISSIIAGDTGELVIMHKKGIEILNTKTGLALHYGKNNGIFQEQVNLNVIGKDQRGSIWVGTDSGMIILLPGHRGTRWEPKTIISSFSVFGNLTDTDTKLVFPYTENNITIAYDGLHFSDPDQVQFQYKLDGYHKEWISSNDRQVNFPRLSPGHYQFHVRSSLDGNFSPSAPASLQFVITLPFWKTWWFIMLSSATVVLLFYWLMKQRVEHFQKLDRLKQDKINAELQTLRAQVNPHFLFNSFNTLMSVIEDNPEKALEYTGQLSNFYRNMLTYRETDLIQLSEEVSLLQTYIYLQQQRFGTGLDYQFLIDESILTLYRIPPLTLQMLAENALKHNAVSINSPLHLELLFEKENIIVRNNIIRKRMPEKGEGVGLKNIMHRYALYTAKPVTIEENEYSFSVHLPLIKNNQHAHPDH